MIPNGGMIPWKRFPLMDRSSNCTQHPRLTGILPNNMFSETSNSSRFIQFPTSTGRTPVNWLVDKSRKVGENERPIICGNSKTLRLLLARFKSNKFWHLLRLRWMLPWRLFSYKYNSIIIVKFPIEDGMFPYRLFVFNAKICNFWGFPISKRILLDVEGHLWKAQWKEKPNDEGHRKLTMNS